MAFRATLFVICNCRACLFEICEAPRDAARETNVAQKVKSAVAFLEDLVPEIPGLAISAAQIRRFGVLPERPDPGLASPLVGLAYHSRLTHAHDPIGRSCPKRGWGARQEHSTPCNVSQEGRLQEECGVL